MERERDFQKKNIYYDLKHQKIGDLVRKYWNDDNLSSYNCSKNSSKWKQNTMHIFDIFLGGVGGGLGPRGVTNIVY